MKKTFFGLHLEIWESFTKSWFPNSLFSISEAKKAPLQQIQNPLLKLYGFKKREPKRDVMFQKGVENIWIFACFWSCWENPSKILRAAVKLTALVSQQNLVFCLVLPGKRNQMLKLGSRLSFWMKIVVILWIFSALQVVLSFSAWEKSLESTPNRQKWKHI